MNIAGEERSGRREQHVRRQEEKSVLVECWRRIGCTGGSGKGRAGEDGVGVVARHHTWSFTLRRMGKPWKTEQGSDPILLRSTLAAEPRMERREAG